MTFICPILLNHLVLRSLRANHLRRRNLIVDESVRRRILYNNWVVTLAPAQKFGNYLNIDCSFLWRRYRWSLFKTEYSVTWRRALRTYNPNRFPCVGRERHFDDGSGKRSLNFPQAVLYLRVVTASQPSLGVIKYHLGNWSCQQLLFLVINNYASKRSFI